MQLVGLDFETYWELNNYSLSKLDTRKYIMDYRFETIGVSIKLDDQPAFWLTDTVEISMMFTAIPWDEVAVYSHNINFDGGILTWRYGRKPKFWLDTLSMARAEVKPLTGSASLDAMGKHLGLPTLKGDLARHAAGVRRAQMPPAFLRDYGRYSCNDLEMCYGGLQALMPRFSLGELKLIDRTTRMYLEPRLQLNAMRLSTHLRKVKEDKENLLEAAGVSDKLVGSAEKFAAALRLFGVDPPTKISPTTGQTTYAFAKKDLAFLDLQEHEDPMVQALVAARLGIKSTLEESRTERLLDIANVFGDLAVPLLYAGAHTGRTSGGGKLNLQNLTRGSEIRFCIKAARGHVLVAADARQIEARLLAWFCGQWNIVRAFAGNVDVYALAATDIYQRPIDRSIDVQEGQVGKVAVLQLGYGSGSGTFWHMCKAQKIEIDPLEAERITYMWRQNNPAIVKGWYDLFGRVKTTFLNGVECDEPYKCIRIGYSEEKVAGFIRLPGGFTIWYPRPHIGTDKHENVGFGYIKNMKSSTYFKTLWHGEIMNNVIQGLARVITMGHGVEISEYPAAPWVLQVHDELVFHPKQQHAEAVAEACALVMSTPPDWARGLPLATEVKIGRNYGECK